MTSPGLEKTIWDIDPISSLLQSVHFQHVSKRLRSISIASEKRGEGKTTISILMARGLTEIYGFKVLLVDLNSQGDVLISKYLMDYKTNDGMVVDSEFPFDIFRIKDLDVDWTKTSFDGPYLNRAITNFTSRYDIVLVDNSNPKFENDLILKVNTDTNLIVSSNESILNEKSKLKIELERDRKNILGVIFNEYKKDE